MSTNTVTNSTLSAARKRDEMLEPYEWKRSRTVLRREGASNRPDLVDNTYTVTQELGHNSIHPMKRYLVEARTGAAPKGGGGA